MSDSATIALRDALATTIVTAGLAPTLRLPNGANAGDSTITVNDASALVPGGILDFYDGSGEFPAVIASISGDAVTLDLTGRGITGLQYSHAADALCATCILRSEPNPLDDTLAALMTTATRPLWHVFVPDVPIAWPENDAITADATAIMTQLAAVPAQTAGGSLQSNLFLQQLHDVAASNVATLIHLLAAEFVVTVNDQESMPFPLRMREMAQLTAWGLQQRTPVWEHQLRVDFTQLYIPID